MLGRGHTPNPISRRNPVPVRTVSVQKRFFQQVNVPKWRGFILMSFFLLKRCITFFLLSKFSKAWHGMMQCCWRFIRMHFDVLI